MNTDLDPRIGLATSAEIEVFRALQGLPVEYQVEPRPASMVIANGDRPYFYEPTLLVSDRAGRKLVGEVMSPDSMSWFNMATFVQIDRAVRAAGMGFMILIPGTQVVRSTPVIPEFNAVNVVYGKDRASFVKAVIEALQTVPLPSKSDAA